MQKLKIKNISKIEHSSKRYDISVADNNNLFANDILIHNCQNMPQVLEQFKDEKVYITEKIDGQSVTFTGKMVSSSTPIIGRFLSKKFKFVVCSRNFTVTDPNSVYWRMAKKYHMEQILKENPTLTIQGEQVGPGIQGNKYNMEEVHVLVFTIKDHEKNYYYDAKQLLEFCTKYALDTVPFVQNNFDYTFGGPEPTRKLSDLGSTVQELVEFSRQKSTSVWSNIPREGIVIRCIRDGKKILSFKVLNPDFLLKYKQ